MTVIINGFRLTVEGGSPPPRLIPDPVRAVGRVELRDASGATVGSLSKAADSRLDVEVFQSVSGLAVIVTDPGGARYLCFSGSRVQIADCVVELAAGSAQSSRRHARSTPARAAHTGARQSVTTQAAVAAGGLATRFAPISGPRTGHSKPGVPIAAEVSLIRLIVAQLFDAGITDVFINTHYAAERLRSGLRGLPGRLHFLQEAEPSGTAGPLRKALQGAAFPAFDAALPLLVVQGDALTDVSLPDLLLAHERLARPALSIAVQMVPAEDVHKFGIVATDETGADGKSGRVVGFLEKPALADAGPHRLASTGIYVLDSASYPIVLDAYRRKLGAAQVESGGEREVSLDFARDVFPVALGQCQATGSGASMGSGIQAILAEGYWNDIGSPEQYFQGLRDLCAGLVQLRGAPPLPDMDATGVVYWRGGRACVERASAISNGNVIVVPATLCESNDGSVNVAASRRSGTN